MKVFTFPQKKIARTKEYLNNAINRRNIIDSEILRLTNKLKDLTREKTHADAVVSQFEQKLTNLNTRFVKSKGSRIDVPCKASKINWFGVRSKWSNFEYSY